MNLPPHTPVVFEGQEIGSLTNVRPGLVRTERVLNFVVPTFAPAEVELTINGEWLPLLQALAETPGARIVLEVPRG